MADAGDAVLREQERLRVALSSGAALRVKARGLVVEAGAVACDLAALPVISDAVGAGRRAVVARWAKEFMAGENGRQGDYGNAGSWGRRSSEPPLRQPGGRR